MISPHAHTQHQGSHWKPSSPLDLSEVARPEAGKFSLTSASFYTSLRKYQDVHCWITWQECVEFSEKWLTCLQKYLLPLPPAVGALPAAQHLVFALLWISVILKVGSVSQGSNLPQVRIGSFFPFHFAPCGGEHWCPRAEPCGQAFFPWTHLWPQAHLFTC